MKRPAASLVVILLALLSTSFSQDASDLIGSSWQLVRFQGSDDKTLTPDDKSRYTIAFAKDGIVSVRLDCNRGHGTWKSAGPSQLEFGALALTRAMCPPGSLHDQIAKQWPYVRSYIIKNGHLFLSLMADGGIYEYEPQTSASTAGSGENQAQPPEASTVGQVKGVASYRERMALPANAVLVVTLEDVSRADGVAEEIGQTRIERPGNPPIPFMITYDPSRIQPGHRYAVRARILVEDLFFTTDQNYPVLTAGQGSEVSLMLRRPAASTPGVGVGETSVGQLALESTEWKLTRLGDQEIQTASQQRVPYLTLNPESHRVVGSGGCNRLTGSYELNGDQLKFGELAGTMMACIDGMDTEKAFMQTLQQVSKWKIVGKQLQLSNAAGDVVARFDPRSRN